MLTNEADLATLKAAILADADPAVIAARTSGNINELTRLYNIATTYIIWKTKVTWDEIMRNGMDWTRVDNLTTGSRYRIWEWMFDNAERAVDPSKPNIRAGINAAWPNGNAADVAVRDAVYVHCKRAATKAERVFTTAGDGNGTTALPAYLGIINGPITADEIATALNLP